MNSWNGYNAYLNQGGNINQGEMTNHIEVQPMTAKGNGTKSKTGSANKRNMKGKGKRSFDDGSSIEKKEAIAVKYPKRITDILMQWMIDHKADPFPDQRNISELMMKTGLDQTQIVNWTTNVRKRNMKATCEGTKKPHHFIDFLFLAQDRENRMKQQMQQHPPKSGMVSVGNKVSKIQYPGSSQQPRRTTPKMYDKYKQNTIKSTPFTNPPKNFVNDTTSKTMYEPRPKKQENSYVSNGPIHVNINQDAPILLDFCDIWLSSSAENHHHDVTDNNGGIADIDDLLMEDDSSIYTKGSYKEDFVIDETFSFENDNLNTIQTVFVAEEIPKLKYSTTTGTAFENVQIKINNGRDIDFKKEFNFHLNLLNECKDEDLQDWAANELGIDLETA